jgi:hypothetical protein
MRQNAHRQADKKIYYKYMFSERHRVDWLATVRESQRADQPPDAAGMAAKQLFFGVHYLRGDENAQPT